MALSTVTDWTQKFAELGIADAKASEYAAKFHQESISIDQLVQLDKTSLQELGVDSWGDRLRIDKIITELKKGQSSSSSGNTDQGGAKYKSVDLMKPLWHDMTPTQFNSWCGEWEMQKKLNKYDAGQLTTHLYRFCNDQVKNDIKSYYTIKEVMDMSEEDFLTFLKRLVTKSSHSGIKRCEFYKLRQHHNEDVKKYFYRLKAACQDCEFICSKCHKENNEPHVRDQFINGLIDPRMQYDLSCRVELKSLDELLQHAVILENAANHSNAQQNEVARLTLYQKNKRMPKNFSGPSNASDRNTEKCRNCGRKSHSSMKQCSAQGKTCHSCGKSGHFKNTQACENSKYNKSIRAVHDYYDDSEVEELNELGFIGAIECSTNEIMVNVVPLTEGKNKRSRDPTLINVFPDSGASICIAGPKHQQQLQIEHDELDDCRKRVKAVGGTVLTCYGCINVKFSFNSYTTTQTLYFCENVNRIYFSKKACIDVGILHPEFPNVQAIDQLSVEGKSTKHQLKNSPYFLSHGKTDKYVGMVQPGPEVLVKVEGKSTEIDNETCGSSVCTTPEHVKPSKIPYAAIEKNVVMLKQYLLDEFEDVFNKDKVLPVMTGPPLKIKLKKDAVPKCRNSWNTVPVNLKSATKRALDDGERRGKWHKLKPGTRTAWRTGMVPQAKKNGEVRITTDFQYLNSQCERQAHPVMSPFKLASEIPPGTKKTVLDAVDGYCSILLDEESKLLTAFITEWGTYMHDRAAQGFMEAGDAYNERYDTVIAENCIERFKKIVDDICLYDFSIEDAFWHVWEFLNMCSKNGIVLNKHKFQFCQDTISFAGLKITSSNVVPSDALLDSIRNFPALHDIHDVRSWFGLINQVSYAHQTAPEMEPFRELIKKNAKFRWDEQLQELFENSKEMIIRAVHQGVQMYDVGRTTALQCDWSKQGVGYVLLQKHCKCPTEKSVLCCPDGWRLVFTGSRFTNSAESGYSPTEGEALAVTFALKHSHHYVYGCQDLIIVTDHKPLLGIFNNRDLSTIENPRILRLKEKTLRYRFTLHYCPGRWNKGPDALSRHPHGSQPKTADDEVEDGVASLIEIALEGTNEPLVAYTGVTEQGDIPKAITLGRLKDACRSDDMYQKLVEQTQSGFPDKKCHLSPHIMKFWDVRDRLIVHDGVLLMGQRMIIPVALRTGVLKILHMAHQGCTGMAARARRTVYWPGIDKDVANKRNGCQYCTTHAPSQPEEPMINEPVPQYPFQIICADYFALDGHHYLAVADRFSGWLLMYHFPKEAKAAQLIKVCRRIFSQFGVPERLDSDGGPQFISQDFNNFLELWGCHHRQSSVAYPQSNGRAEAAVKSAKRMIRDCTAGNGSLDTDKVHTALLQYRNTPIQTVGLSPAQMLFFRDLKDFMPSDPVHYQLHSSWLAKAEMREKQAAQTVDGSAKVQQDHSQKALAPLNLGDHVAVQEYRPKDKGKWTLTGRIVDKKPFRQYSVKIDGSGRITLRNRRHLRPIPKHLQQTDRPWTVTTSVKRSVRQENEIAEESGRHQSIPPDNNSRLTAPAVRESQDDNDIDSLPHMSRRHPMALKRLQSHNSPGLKEHRALRSTRHAVNTGQAQA